MVIIARSGKFLVVLLVISSLAVSGVRVSHGLGSSPSGKDRYYPLAREYRQQIEDKIEAPALASTPLPISHLERASGSSFQHQDKRDCGLRNKEAPLDLLMSLQP
jgi:hypothetical protein